MSHSPWAPDPAPHTPVPPVAPGDPFAVAPQGQWYGPDARHLQRPFTGPDPYLDYDRYGRPLNPIDPAHAAPSGTWQRPGIVTAAAVLAFIAGGLGSLGLIALMALGEFDTPFLTYLAVVGLLFGGIFVWGGVAALTGRSSRILVVLAIADVVLEIVLLVLTRDPSGGLLFPILIWVFLMQRRSRDWFRLRGGRTF
ncbi:hypothetical protein GIS00_03915 [Nakamurella sp. YIM 132087]|uniref:Uncharacterized protein n=1 Tax=Nakamurella alba TaxID=2665158 RepID=A0A7K1FIL2_9ACTN|nr:hypothetical protein [Nakamurella alba]MTD13093.1 hypothetical protein [Nakamurella alba]